MKRIHPILCAATILVGIAAAQSQPRVESSPIQAPLRSEFAALDEQSSWRIDTESPAVRGALPIGNGFAFACLGLSDHGCALDAITGPRYGAGDVDSVGDGAFGGLLVELVDASGTALPIAHRSVARVRGTGVVVAEDQVRGATLRATAFAVAGSPRIELVLEVVAVAGALPTGLSLRVKTSRDAEGDGDRLLLRRKNAVAAITLSGATPRQGRLMTAIGSDTNWRGVLTIATAEGDAPPRQTADLERAKDDLGLTLNNWAERFSRVPTFDTDHQRMRDLYRDCAVDVLTQCCAATGAAVPMLGRRVFALRTQSGALLALLRLRLFDDARRIVDLTFDAVCATRRLEVEYPLDFDRKLAATADAAGAEFWRNLPIVPAEIPSLVILQHYWYWRTTRDLAPIENHWLLLETCLKRPTRGTDSMMPFSGDEPWSPAQIAKFDPTLIGSDPALFGQDRDNDRSSWSFVSGVLFLLSLQQYGELGDARDSVARPNAWAAGKPADAPSNAYLRRAVSLLQEIEKRFWIADLERFAPAVSPVDGAPIREALANASLMPLWAGWTYPTGEKSRQNLEHALAGLWQHGARVGSTRTISAATGDLIGMLLVAVSERDDTRRMEVFDAALDAAAPTGCWSNYVDGNGRPLDPDGAGPLHLVHCDPGVSGIVFDALMFAMTGIRHAAVPHWDDDGIRLELRLPHGADYVSLRGTEKDGRVLDLFFRRTVSMMTEDERKANDEATPERRRDPNVPHERLRFVVELLDGAPKEGYYHADIDAMGTMFVRYLKREAPTSPEEHDFRRIEEFEFSKQDSNSYFSLHDGPGRAPAGGDLGVPEGTHTLALTWRPHFADLVRGPGVAIVDCGAPLTLDGLRDRLFDGDRPRVARVVTDWHFASEPPITWNRALFRSPGWQQLLARYSAAGGQVSDSGFVREAKLGDAGLTAGEDGAFHIAAGTEPARVRVAIPLGSPSTAIHIGASIDCRVLADGVVVLSATGRLPVQPDSDAALLTGKGLRELTVELDPSPSAERVVFLRLVGPDGLPPR